MRHRWSEPMRYAAKFAQTCLNCGMTRRYFPSGYVAEYIDSNGRVLAIQRTSGGYRRLAPPTPPCTPPPDSPGQPEPRASDGSRDDSRGWIKRRR